MLSRNPESCNNGRFDWNAMYDACAEWIPLVFSENVYCLKNTQNITLCKKNKKIKYN